MINSVKRQEVGMCKLIPYNSFVENDLYCRLRLLARIGVINFLVDLGCTTEICVVDYSPHFYANLRAFTFTLEYISRFTSGDRYG